MQMGGAPANGPGYTGGAYGAAPQMAGYGVGAGREPAAPSYGATAGKEWIMYIVRCILSCFTIP